MTYVLVFQYTAPKSVSRIPKLVNSTLLRVQRELCAAYKPSLEVLNFFFGDDCKRIIEVFPDMADKMSSMKLLLSQSLASKFLLILCFYFSSCLFLVWCFHCCLSFSDHVCFY